MRLKSRSNNSTHAVGEDSAKLNGLLAGIEPWRGLEQPSWERLQEDYRKGSLAADSWQDKAGLFFPLCSASMSTPVSPFSPPSSVVHELRILLLGLVNRQSKSGKRHCHHRSLPMFFVCLSLLLVGITAHITNHGLAIHSRFSLALFHPMPSVRHQGSLSRTKIAAALFRARTTFFCFSLFALVCSSSLLALVFRFSYVHLFFRPDDPFSATSL